MRTAVSALLLMLVACASSTPSILTPKTGPGTDYPCGVHGRSCGNHMCCDEEEACGGVPFSGCPANMCCFTGESDMVGARPPHPQRPEVAP